MNSLKVRSSSIIPRYLYGRPIDTTKLTHYAIHTILIVHFYVYCYAVVYYDTVTNWVIIINFILNHDYGQGVLFIVDQ